MIGEHVDYNGGLCLPFALRQRTYVALAPRGDDLLRIANRCPVHRTLENGPVIVGGKGQDTA